MNYMKTRMQWTSLIIGCYFLPTNLTQNCHITKMSVLAPPPSVRGMRKLDRRLFDHTINVPCLKIKSDVVLSVTEILKKYLLKLRNIKPIRSIEAVVSKPIEDNTIIDESREVLLNPKIISCFTDLDRRDQERLGQLGVTDSCLQRCMVHLTYDNWTADDVVGAVLPEEVETAPSFSMIGHIVHLNLKEHLCDYKYLIGEVLLDKIKQARTVVNKVDTIDSTFRVFNMEVLAGESEFVTVVKENGLSFKFDFSTVYWNPRLATEHERIIKKLNPGNTLYDVFAGVGPFSIPAAKKKCIVLANDLNPESYKWLQYNAKLNKVEKCITSYNKDGADFIRNEVKQHIFQEKGERESHVVMNLPALAVTFLSVFKQLFPQEQLSQIKNLPFVHVYCFVKGKTDPKEMAQALVEEMLNCSISEAIDEIFFVRNVAPNKNMMRVSFKLTKNIILGGKRQIESDSSNNSTKKMK